MVAPNFYNQPLAAWLILLLFLLALAGMRRLSAQTVESNMGNPGDPWRIYLVFWAFLPMVFAWLGFFLVLPPILNARYFIYCTPPLMLLVVLGLEALVRLIDRITMRTSGKSAWGHYTRSALLYALLAAAILVLPRGYDAAITRKHDWRGAARQLVSLVQSDPGRNYAVIETSHRDTPLLDFYLQRYSPSLRVAGMLTASEESRLASGEIAQPAILQSPALAHSDYLVVVFIHFRQTAFPQASALLEAAYPVRLRLLDSDGRGYVIYDLRTSGE